MLPLGSKTAQSQSYTSNAEEGFPAEGESQARSQDETSRVRRSLGSEVYTNNSQVIIANRDNWSHDFKKDIIGSFSCSYLLHQTGLGKRVEEAGWVPQTLSDEMRGLPGQSK